MIAKVSTKGQLVLPSEVRERHGWGPGTELEVVDRGDVVVLRSVRAVPATTWDDVIGCAGYTGPARTVEEMEESVARAFRGDRERQG